jgi:hypothetical protein
VYTVKNYRHRDNVIVCTTYIVKYVLYSTSERIEGGSPRRRMGEGETIIDILVW